MAQSCMTLFNPMDCNLSGSSVHGILQARILKWVAISSSRGSSQPRDWTQVSYISCIVRQVLSHWYPPGEAHQYIKCYIIRSTFWTLNEMYVKVLKYEELYINSCDRICFLSKTELKQHYYNFKEKAICMEVMMTSNKKVSSTIAFDCYSVPGTRKHNYIQFSYVIIIPQPHYYITEKDK